MIILESVSFVPKIENPLDDVIKILYDEVEHKKTTHPYISPQAQTAPTIETETQAIEDEFGPLKQEFDRVNNAATEQKKTSRSNWPYWLYHWWKKSFEKYRDRGQNNAKQKNDPFIDFTVTSPEPKKVQW